MTVLRTFEDYPYHKLLDYAGIDAIVTLDIFKKMWPTISRRPQYVEYYTAVDKQVIQHNSILWEMKNVKAEALRFIVDMEVCGMPYDVAGNYAMRDAMAAEIDQLTTSILSQIDLQVNLDSGKELGFLLYSHYGFEPPMKTKSGGDATSGDAIGALFERYQHPWLAQMQKRRNMVSVFRSFIVNYVEDFVKSDGRIHPEYNLHGTSSHRISSDSPNLLNLPRSCYQYDIRSLYIVPEGYVFITFDFSSCEVKVLAALSQDETMIKAILEGKDFHTYTASLLSGVDYDSILHVLESSKEELAADPALKAKFKEFKDLRQAAKATTFGILYGSSTAAIAMKLGISVDEAEKLIAAYFEAYPRIKNFVTNSHLMAKANHYVYSPFAQMKQEFGTLPCYRNSAVYNACLRNSQNVRIQGTASTLGLMAFTEVNKRFKEIGGSVMCTVYDSIEAYVPIARVAEAIEIGFYCMDDWPQEQFPWLTFPIGADAEIGFNWGSSLVKVHRHETQERCEQLLGLRT